MIVVAAEILKHIATNNDRLRLGNINGVIRLDRDRPVPFDLLPLLIFDDQVLLFLDVVAFLIPDAYVEVRLAIDEEGECDITFPRLDADEWDSA